MVIKIVSEFYEDKAEQTANELIAEMTADGYTLKSMQYRPVAAVVAEAADGFTLKHRHKHYTTCRHNILLVFDK